MIKFMDEIVEAVEEFARIVAVGVLFTIEALVKLLIIATVPVWILPYKLIRNIMLASSEGKLLPYQKGECENGNEGNNN